MADEVIIPEGWTFFSHNTNSERWNEDILNISEIVVNPNKVMSVITERDIYDYYQHYGNRANFVYSGGKGTPIEIRCLICDRNCLDSLPFEIKELMSTKFYYDRDNFGGAYGQRHHSIPQGEKLIVLAVSDIDNINGAEKHIIWAIPISYIDYYEAEVNKGNNRIIKCISKRKSLAGSDEIEKPEKNKETEALNEGDYSISM